MIGISVIIPTYNREMFISSAISSVLQQDFDGKIEVIISDDGSTDGTVEVAKSFQEVVVIKRPSNTLNQGASSARNRGLQHATQPLICFLDSDDYFLPGHLKKIAGAILSKPNLGFAFCLALESRELRGSEVYRRWTKCPIKAVDVRHPIASNFFVANTNVFIFKRNVFEEVGVFDEELRVGEDTDMWFRITEKFRGAFSDHFGAVVRSHDMGQLTNTPKELLLDGHARIYRNAIIRAWNARLGLYRFERLFLQYIKFKCVQFSPLLPLYVAYVNRSKKRRFEVDKWWPLEHFVESSFKQPLTRVR